MLASVAWILLLAYGGKFLSFSADTRVFFSRDNPHLLALESLENIYSKTDYLAFVVAPKDGDVFTRESLTAIEKMTEASWQIPYSSRVSSMTNHQHIEADGDDLLVSSLVEDASSLTDTDIERIRHITLGSPRLIGRLVSENGAISSIITVLANKPSNDVNAVQDIAAYARGLAGDFAQKYPDIAFYPTGSVMFDAAFLEVPQQDMKTLVPLMFLLMLLIMWLILRTLWGTVGILTVILMSVIGTLGAAGWYGVVLNAGVMSAPIIILTLSVAHCVHVISTMQLARRDGAGKHEAITESLRINMSPIFISSVTTAIGFMSLNFSDAPPFRLLGNISAAGIMIAFVLSMTFLPAFMAATPNRVGVGQARSRLAMEWFSEFVITHRAVALWVTSGTILALMLGMIRITIDDNFVKYFDKQFPARMALEFAEDNRIGFGGLEYSIPGGADGAITDPTYLTDLEKLADWFRRQPKVTYVASFSTIMKQLNQNMHGDDPAYFRIPKNKEIAAQYLLLYEISLPYGFDINNQINISKSATRFMVTMIDMSSGELRQLDRRAQAWMSANVPSFQSPATGQLVVTAYISERNINAMLVGCVIALVLISFILIFALRSLKMGLVSLLPNLFPATMAFGLWGYINGEIGLGLSTVLAMTLGIVVDDTVHFLSKYLRARREHHMDALQACQFVFGTAGPALWITSVTLIVGFGVLSLSEFKVNADMGLLSAFTIALALVTDFVFLPAILMRFDSRLT